MIPSFTHLKDESYYDELYDRFTIESCKQWEDTSGLEELPTVKDTDPKKAAIKLHYVKKLVIPVGLYVRKGERYAKKHETIQQWMAQDRAKDAQVASAVEPQRIRCIVCSQPMQCISRDLMSDAKDNERVLFMFECATTGHKRRAYWEGGEEWIPRPHPCSACGTDMQSIDEHKGTHIVTTYTCPSCTHTETQTLDLTRKEKEVDPNFEADRKKYCLSDKEGGEYVSWMATSRELTHALEDQKKNKKVYEAAAKIKVLNLAYLQKLLTSALEPSGYIKLDLGNPEMKKDLFVDFSAVFRGMPEIALGDIIGGN